MTEQDDARREDARLLEDARGELAVTLAGLRLALENQGQLVAEAHKLRTSNRLLRALVAFAAVIVIGLGAVGYKAWTASSEANDAAHAAEVATQRVANNVAELTRIRIASNFAACEAANELHAFQRAELADDAAEPTTVLEDIPFLSDLSPELRNILVLLDERNEVERLKAVEVLAEFDRRIPVYNCEAIRDAEELAAQEVLADDPND